MTDRPHPTICWFRRDLRLSDNPALVDAAARGPVVPLFVDDPVLTERAGQPRLAFLAHCLSDLADRTDHALVVRSGSPSEVLVALAQELEAQAVVAAEDFGPYGSRRDDAVETALRGVDVEFRRVGSPYAVPPGTVTTGSGGHFKVFTPFYKAWRGHGHDGPVRRPRIDWVTGVDGDPFPAAPEPGVDLPPAGEEAAKRRLDRFLAGPVEQYHDRRNRPAEDGTSRLSVYLKWGCLHPRQILDRLGRTEGEETFRTELAWREFYADVLYHRPETASQAFRSKMAGIRLNEGATTDERFAAWREGRTGYPIVDAGMRQLAGEGWVHNRVRMIVASFLVKDLHVDWTRGARVFLDRLVDADLASNQHGWQWVAGTGTDPAPYFRVFNPVTQSAKFDPDGTYIRRWVPELADVRGRAVHEPWTLSDPPADYPARIVDHAEERREALARYEEVR